jgi:hypothetical protein
MLHAWAKVIKGIVAHPVARVAITSAQRIVTFVRASHGTLAAFQALHKLLNLSGGGLITSNTTRLTSIIQMVASVARNESVLQALLGREDMRLPSSLVDDIKDPAFWRTVKGLGSLLRPVEQVRQLWGAGRVAVSCTTRFLSALL